MDEIVFSSLIAFNGKLTSQCDNLSTHHYHTTYYPCFDTQFRHSQTTQQYFCAVAISLRKSESDRAALLYQRDRLRENKEIAFTKIGLARKGVPRKGCERHSKTTKSRSGSCAWRFCGDDFVASFPALRVRHRVLFFVMFVPVNFKFVPFFVFLGIANVGLA